MKLTNPQKASIALAAKSAYKFLEPLDLVGGLTEEDWRRGEVFSVTRKRSTKDCVQGDFVPLINHFNVLVGKAPMKNNTPSDSSRVVWLIKEAMRKWEFDLVYLKGLLEDRFRRQLGGYETEGLMEAMQMKLSEKELWQVLYTLNTQGPKKTKTLNKKTGLTPEDIALSQKGLASSDEEHQAE